MMNFKLIAFWSIQVVSSLVVLSLLVSSCAYTPARAYKFTEAEQHDGEHEYLMRKVESLQEQVYELRDRLDELEQQKIIMIPDEPFNYGNIEVIAEDVSRNEHH